MSETFKTLAREICAERGIGYAELSYGWIIRLERDGEIRHIIGNRADVNAAAADRIACDKCACSELLLRGGVPAVPHKLVFNPLERSNWIDGGGTWRQALEFLEKHGRVVVKPNNGWQGNGVELCETPAELERALHEIFRKEPDACLCPFYEFNHEYRVFYLNGETPLIYGKKRAPGSWKHNLSGGASAFEIEDGALLAKLRDTAVRAAKCIGITFATADIAKLNDGGLMVVEINSGVAVQKFLEQFPQKRDAVKNMYAEAITLMFENRRYLNTLTIN